MSSKLLSIIVSVYNEESVLNRFYEAFLAFCPNIKWNYELIFVNDGSTDNSLNILTDICAQNPNVKVINLSRNYGHEAAMIAGIDNAVGDGLICMDSDLQHPLECIPGIIAKFEEGFEVINMVRTSNSSVGIFHRLASSLFYKLVNRLSRDAEFAENASDFFAISQRVADVLRNNYREKVRFLRGYVQSVGFKKTTLPYSAAARAGGKSHYSLRKLLHLSASSIVSFSDFPLKVGIYAGIFCALCGIATFIYTLITYHDAPSGYATIVTLICLLFAAMFIVIGIIGEYIAVLFAELKDRPIYLIDRTITRNSLESAHSSDESSSLDFSAEE